jgi:hypothetical protein
MAQGLNPDPEDSVGNTFVRFVVAAYDVAQAALDTKPLAKVLSFLDAASNDVVALLPDGREILRERLFRFCHECRLILALRAETEKCDATWTVQLFAELCEIGFSTDLRAVLCVDLYCQWLIARGEAVMAKAAIAQVLCQISHPHFKRELETVAARLQLDDRRTG